MEISFNDDDDDGAGEELDDHDDHPVNNIFILPAECFSSETYYLSTFSLCLYLFPEQRHNMPVFGWGVITRQLDSQFQLISSMCQRRHVASSIAPPGAKWLLSFSTCPLRSLCPMQLPKQMTHNDIENTQLQWHLCCFIFCLNTKNVKIDCKSINRGKMSGVCTQKYIYFLFGI